MNQIRNIIQMVIGVGFELVFALAIVAWVSLICLALALIYR